MKIKQSFFIFAGAAMLPCASLFAQDAAGTPESAPSENTAAQNDAPPAAEEEKTGKAVRVTAAKHEMEMADVPMSVSVVDGDAVTKSSAATVADLLEDVPGVQVSSNGPAGIKYVNIRGEGNNRTVILVDGQKISEQKSMEGIPILTSVQDIERVEVIKGPASVLYGSNAIGGVVNIITKKGPKEDGVHGSVGLRGDSGTHGIDQYYSLDGRFGDFSARVSFSDENHGNVESPKGRLENTDYRVQNSTAYLAYDISEKATFGAKFEMFRGRENSFSNTEGFYPSLPSWDRDKVGLFLDVKDISDTFVKFHADAFFQKTDKDFDQDGTISMGMLGSVPMHVDTRNKLHSYGMNLQADFAFADQHYLIVGADLEYQDLDSTSETQMTFPAMMGGEYLSSRPDSASVLTAALYAQDEWNFAEGWALTLGARGTYVKNELDGTTQSVTQRGTTTATAIPSQSDEDAHATFSVSLVNTQIENWTFRGTVAQGYRYATINELYIGSGMYGTGTTFQANPNLDPESSTTYEIGIRYNNEKLNIDTTFFYTDAEDYINYTTAGGITTPENVDSAKTFGIEIAASYLIEIDENTSLTPYSAFTFMRRKFDNGERSTYDTGDPAAYGKIGIRGAYKESNRSWWVDLNMRANSDSDYVDFEDSDDNWHKAGWATYNFSIGVDITPSRKNPYFEKLTIAFGVDNITDKAYQIAGYADGYWQPGRSYWLSLKYDF